MAVEQLLLHIPALRRYARLLTGDATRADDLVQIAQAVLVKGGTIRDLTSPVAPYPTRGEIFKRAAGKYYESTVFGPAAKAWSAILTAFH